MSNKKLLVIFPSKVFSGHEKMALKILKNINRDIVIFTASNIELNLFSNKKYIYNNFIVFFIKLIKFRLRNRGCKILLISGSPFGHILEKIILKLTFLYLIEYVPMPELEIMRDRLHHNFVPLLNRMLINERILIDDWQKQYSAVKNVTIIKNFV